MRALPAVLLLALGPAAATAAAPTHHELTVRLDPAAHRLEVIDIVRPGPAPDAAGGWTFTLHAGLEPAAAGPAWRLERVAAEEDEEAAVPLVRWRLAPLSSEVPPPRLEYSGAIHHPVEAAGEEYQRSFSETPGIVGPEGVYLAGSSAWLPRFGDEPVAYELTVTGLEPPWDAVSAGARTRGPGSVTWSMPHPTEEVYLVAAPFSTWESSAGDTALYAYLRSDDAALAHRYLDATRRYLAMYESILPPYPYASFALVENFWETGYGMPGFTLLGPQVIRFPWILTSSYPHELLHNWWGNGVYVDLDRGNWCEGLTAYLADHLLAEQRGEGGRHRRDALKRYTDYAGAGRDLALADFRSRRSPATEAVGYGKAMMLLHMLRREVGDAAFLAGLGAFYREHEFERATWDDLARALSTAAARDLVPFVTAWVARTGAPDLALARAEARPAPDGALPWVLEIELEQVQAEPPFPVRVPVAVTLEGEPVARVVWVVMADRSARAEVPLPARPLRVDVDPAFDVMRRLDPLEVPPTLSTALADDDALFVLPAAAAPDELAAWRELAAAFARPLEPRTVLDRDLDALPAGAAWVVGAANRFAGAIVARLEPHGVRRDGGNVVIDGTEVPRADRSLVLVARSDTDPAAAHVLVAADPVEAVAGLARKLPHYGRYSGLAFSGAGPDNLLKVAWSALASPLVRQLGDGPPAALALPPGEPLAPAPPAYDAAALAATVAALADPALAGRGLGSAGLAEATAWVEARLAGAGLGPAGGDGFRQSWTRDGVELTNLLARVPGSDPALADAPVLVLAHLDHLGRGPEGAVHPGADDNASGVAVLLALGERLAAAGPAARPVLLAVTTGEESGLLGARHLVAELPAPPFACLCLDTVGRLGDRPLLVLDAGSAREWRFLWMGVGHTTGLPIEVATERLDASDHGACLDAGAPGVQLTTGPHADYHRPTDTADRVDAAGLARVAEAAEEAVRYLAGRREALTVTIAGAAAPAAAPAGAPRPFLGTVPDFAFAGPGVRVADVLPGSPAAEAGIAAGDVLTALDGAPLPDLPAYAAALRARAPGDSITIDLHRAGEPLRVRAVLRTR